MFGESFHLPFASVFRERQEKKSESIEAMSDDPLEAYIYKCIQDGLLTEQQILFLLGEQGHKEDTMPLPGGKRN